MRYIIAMSGVLLIIGGFLGFASTQQQNTGSPTPIEAVITPTLPPGRQPMRLPADYRDTFEHYITVERGDAMARRVFISPEAVDAVREGLPIPDGTIIVIEAFHAALDEDGVPLRDEQGRYVLGEMEPEVHMAERRSTWMIQDLAASAHLNGWNFDAFDMATGASNQGVRNDCFSCHETADHRDFVFTNRFLQAYAQTGDLQYDFCRLPERLVCG